SADVSPSRLPRGMAGLVLDRQFGLLAVSPVWVLALAGGAALWRWRPGDAMRAALLGGAGFAAGAAFSMWWGGACPPARLVVAALGFWRGGRGLVAGALGYVVLAAGLHAGPLIERRLATLDVLEAWDPGRLRGAMGPLPLGQLEVPMDLPGAPWDVRALAV